MASTSAPGNHSSSGASKCSSSTQRAASAHPLVDATTSAAGSAYQQLWHGFSQPGMEYSFLQYKYHQTMSVTNTDMTCYAEQHVRHRQDKAC